MRLAKRCALGVAAAAAAAGALAASASANQQDTRWVAPYGHGAACTQQNPCALDTARAQVRAAAPTMTRDLTVRLLGGTYRLADTLTLTNADSGRNGHRVVYAAAPGAQPTISGGRVVRGWQLVDPAHRLWKAPVGSLDTRMVTVDGIRARRAVLTPGIPGTVTRTATGFHTDSTVPQSWPSPGDVELVWRGQGAGAFDWTEARCRVTGVDGDANGSDVTVVQPCFDRAVALYAMDTPGGRQTIRGPSWSENSVAFLQDDSRPGRWALQRSAGGNTLWYHARKGQDPRHAKIVAARVGTLVRVAGNGAPAHDIELRGLRFTETSWSGADEPHGFPNVFADGYAVGPNATTDPHDHAFPAGAVELDDTQRVTIADSRFERLGTIGLRASNGVLDARVEGNVFRDLSAGGILLGRIGPDLLGTVRGNVISNNAIENVGAEYGASPGIELNLATETTVEHNHIASTAYTGIIVAGSPGGVDDTHGNRVADNVIEDVMQRSADGGGIYGVQTQGTSLENGLVIEGNLVRNVRPGTLAFGLYTDLVSAYTTVRDNVSYGFTLAMGGCSYPSTDWVFADGNYLSSQPLYFCGGPLNNVTLQNTTIVRSADECAAIARCAEISANAGLDAAHRDRLAGRYQLDDVPTFEDTASSDNPVTGVHWGFDFGRGQWLASYERSGYASTTFARFAAAGDTSRTIALKPGLRLDAITIEGPGSYTLSDGVNPTRSGQLAGAGHPVVVHPQWTTPGTTVTIALSAGQDAIIDDLVAAP